MTPSKGPRVLLGRYRLEGVLGEGTYGQVMLATELGGRWQRRVAVKMLRPTEHPATPPQLEARRRLGAEAALLIRCQPHPHWVQVVADHTAAEPPFFVMEYVPAACSLAALLERAQRVGERISLASCHAYFLGVCRALQHLHEALGVLHRDVKLANIMVVPDGDVWRAKLIDLGMAHDPCWPQTAASSLLGTPLHQPPEVLRHRRPARVLHPGVDLFAMGVALYCLCAGAYPFASEAQLLDPREAPCRTAQFDALPPSWRRLLLKLLHRDPGRRYATAAAVLDDLQKLSVAPLPPPPRRWPAAGLGYLRQASLALALTGMLHGDGSPTVRPPQCLLSASPRGASAAGATEVAVPAGPLPPSRDPRRAAVPAAPRHPRRAAALAAPRQLHHVARLPHFVVRRRPAAAPR